MPRARKAASGRAKSRSNGSPGRKATARRRKLPSARPQSERERVRNLVALDAAALMSRIAARADEMIGLFSRHRDREPLLNPLRSRLPEMGFRELSLLSAREQSAVSAFVEALEALRWYFRYTVDMPSTAEQRFRVHRRSLDACYERLVAAVGPPRADEPEPLP
ncbi:MAG: hypothetical protein ACOX6T_04970 [Myxococcales bacterium]|jgi:hypothetical protein